jgi:signal transduction histidine kinase
MDQQALPGFFAGSSEMSTLMRAHDWAATELGAPLGWSQILRALVGVILDSRQPMFVAWGPRRIMLYNDAYAPLLEHGHPATLGRPFFDQWPDLRTVVEPIMDRTFAGEPIHIDDREVVLHRNGYPEVAHFSFSYTPVRDEAAAVAGLLCVCTETTGDAFRLALEERLRRLADPREVMAAAAELLGAHLSADRAGYAEINAAGDGFTVERDWCSPGMPSLAGRHHLDEFGQSLIAALRAGHTVRFDDALVEPLTAGEGVAPAFVAAGTRAAITVPLVKDGRLDAALYVHHSEPRRWTNEAEVLVREVAERTWAAVERARAEAALRNANDRLEERLATGLAEREAIEAVLRQSQKMEAVGQLTGGLAHDFNNLLTVISVSLEMLELQVAEDRLDDDMDQYIAAALGATSRAAALTHRLLAFSRRQTLDPKPINTDKLIAEMQEMVQRTVGPEIEVEVVGTAGLWPALVDPNQLENALLNLCINARDAMPDGGRLTITTANASVDERSARELDMAPGQYIALSVMDTGTGMSPDVIAHAFEPFFTTKPIGMGTGLGLSMIYGFAKQSGGQAHIRSAAGEGTTMCIYLRRHWEKAKVEQARSDSAKAPRAGFGETFLIVDDEPMVRLLVTKVLEGLGYAAIEAPDGASGLKVLLSDERIDLLITDVGMPGGMNGRQLADAARLARPGLKVLFITGYAENAAIGDGQLEPGMHVLAKPFATKVLASRIKAIIAET